MSSERNRRGDWPTVAFGAFLVVLALVAFHATARLPVGSAGDMGPGYVPRALAWATLGFGLAFAAAGLLTPHQPIARPAWRPLGAILGGIAVFAAATWKLGMVAGAVIAVMLAACAQPPVRWRESLAFALLVAAFAAGLFVKGLGLPIPLWPAWL